jgi:hypothetical protein
MWNCITVVCSLICNIRLCISTCSIWDWCAAAICCNKIENCFTSTKHMITDCCDSITHHNDPNTADHVELTGSAQHHGSDAV